MPLTIWTNVKYPADATDQLRSGVAPHSLVFAQKTEDSNLAAGVPDPALASADVAFGQPDANQVVSCSRIKWVHLNTAGYTAYDRDDVRAAFKSRGAVLTTSSGVYANPCAQHILAMMLAASRKLPQALDAQRADHAWTWRPLRFESMTLTGQTALIVGFGAIARRLVELLAPFNMNLIAVRRSPKGDEPIPTYAESELEKLLPQADHIINILPGGDATDEYFNASCFHLMKPTATFYNIGRGSTVDTYALRASLETRKLAAAYLDVTMPEPLPPDDPLWTTPNSFITPHTAGGQQNEYAVLVSHFLDNFNCFLSSKPMRDRIL